MNRPATAGLGSRFFRFYDVGPTPHTGRIVGMAVFPAHTSATKDWRGFPAIVVILWPTASTPVVTPIPLLARLSGQLARNPPIAQVCSTYPGF